MATKKITSFAAACTVLGIHATLPEVSSLPEKHQKAIHAHYKLVIIAEALNEGWQPDWNNINEPKYFPYFYYDGKKGFSFDLTAYYYRLTYVGSRLCFKNRELAEYAAKKFKKEYKEYYEFT